MSMMNAVACTTSPLMESKRARTEVCHRGQMPPRWQVLTEVLVGAEEHPGVHGDHRDRAPAGQASSALRSMNIAYKSALVRGNICLANSLSCAPMLPLPR